MDFYKDTQNLNGEDKNFQLKGFEINKVSRIIFRNTPTLKKDCKVLSSLRNLPDHESSNHSSSPGMSYIRMGLEIHATISGDTQSTDNENPQKISTLP